MWKVAEIWTTEYSISTAREQRLLQGSLAGPPLPRTTTWGAFPRGIGTAWRWSPSALH